MIYATVQLPGGDLIHLNEHHRWEGEDPRLVGFANDYERSFKYYPDITAGLAKEVAAELGGKVLYVRPYVCKPLPPGAQY